MKTIKSITATPLLYKSGFAREGWDVVITNDQGHNFDYDCPEVLDAILDYLGLEVTYDYEEPITEELKEY